MNSKLISVVCCCLMGILLTGCTSTLKVTHSPLEPIAQKRQGTIHVHQFTDSRKKDQRYIGNSMDQYRIIIRKHGIQGGKSLEVAVTEFFAEALNHAGYDVVIQSADGTLSKNNAKVDAILRGEINEFWLQTAPMRAWQEINIDLRLFDKGDNQVVWKKNIHGDENNISWIGTLGSSYEKAISEALDKVLNRAAAEFASDQFYQKVKEGK